MNSQAPFPMNNELLQAHPIYKRAQGILTAWYDEQVQSGQTPEKSWQQDQLAILNMISGKTPPDKTDWYWTTSRDLTVLKMLTEFVTCTYHEEPEERMRAWRALQETVSIWDEKFAPDTDVA